MFKRNLLKRTLPIMLSVAMTFQSVPITAMAAAAPSDSEQVSDQGMENVADGASGEESAPEESADDISGMETNDQENSGSEGDAEISEETKTETEKKTETSQAEIAAGAEKDGEEVRTATEIKFEEKDISGFTLQKGESDLTYTIQYSTSDKFGSVVTSIKNAAKIFVDDEEKKDADAKSFLNTEWQKKDDNEVWVAMPGRPEAVGSYRLKLSLEAQNEGLWTACENYVYFNITKRELTLDLDKVNDQVKAGSKIKDFTDLVLKKVKLKDGTTALRDEVYEVEAAVYKDGEEEATEDVYFSKDVDYHFVVTVKLLDASMVGNYEADCDGKEYPIHFTGIRKTKVEVTLKDPGKVIAKIYGKDGTKWSIEDIEKEYVDTEKTVVMAEADTVDTIKAVPLWCVKENNNQNNTNIYEEDDIDKDRQFL